ncbi:MAG: 4Fe-4S binding protein, partial [Anaerolineales bacterium]
MKVGVRRGWRNFSCFHYSNFARRGSSLRLLYHRPRWGFLIDLERCIGCKACTVACKTEFGVPLG